MNPEEVRLLDNKYALLFIRGERPIVDYKYNILKHPNVEYTTDGKGKPYIHGGTERARATIFLNEKLQNNKYLNIKELEDLNEKGRSYEILTEEEVEEIIFKGGL